MTRQAHCDSCAITYRVPGARRMYRCKSCNAELEPRDEPEPTGHEPCHACSALQPASASFCAACGEDLDPASEEAWRAAGKDLRQALKRLRRFRASMLANTSIYLLILLVFLVVWIAEPSSTFGEGHAPWPLALLTLFAAFTFIAWRQALRYPVHVVILAAIPATVGLLLSYWHGRFEVAFTIWTLGLWGLMPDALAIRRLSQEYPDLIAARRLRGEDPFADRRRERSGQRRITSRRRQERRTLALRVALVLGLSVLIGVGHYVWRLSQRPPYPPDPGPTLAAFRAAWNAADLRTVSDFRPPGKRASFERSLGVWQDHYGWGDALPPAGHAAHGEPFRGQTRLVVDFPSEGGNLQARFELQDGTWQLTRFGVGELEHWRP